MRIIASKYDAKPLINEGAKPFQCSQNTADTRLNERKILSDSCAMCCVFTVINAIAEFARIVTEPLLTSLARVIQRLARMQKRHNPPTTAQRLLDVEALAK